MPTEAENAVLRHKLSQMQAQLDALQRPRSDQEAEEIGAAQARADAVHRTFGEAGAPPPVAGETSLAYRRRLLRRFLPYSARMKDARLDGCGNAALGAVEDIVYADAAIAARNPETPGITGKLIATETDDGSGRKIVEFSGDPMVWMASFMTSGRKGHFVRESLVRPS